MNPKLVVALLLGLLLLGALLSRSQKPGKDATSAETVARPKLPAPALKAQPAASTEPVVQESRIKKMMKGEALPEVTLRDLDIYLEQNHRNAESLIAALHITGNKELLREAAERFPDDPRVAWESWFRTQDPAERQKWLERWEKASPDNALANYLAAANLFKSGKTDAAIEKLEAAAGKIDFSFFAGENMLNAEEAYRAAGYSEAEAKVASTTGLLLPHLAELKKMSQSLSDLSTAYRQAGDEASARAVISMGLQMAGKFSSSQSFLIGDLVGIAIQANLWKSADPSGPSGVPGKTVQDMLDSVAAQREALKLAAKSTEAYLQSMNEQDLVAWCNRVRLVGEAQAMRWLQEKYGASAPSASAASVTR